MEIGPRNQGLDSTPASVFVGPAASPCYILEAPCVKGGNGAPQTAAAVPREPGPACTVSDTGLTHRLVLLPEGEVRKAWMSPVLRKDVGSGLPCFTPRAVHSWP